MNHFAAGWSITENTKHHTHAMSRSEPLKFYATYPHACAYIDGFEATDIVADPEAPMDAEVHGQLADLGFRRSGDLLYRPHCRECARCVSVRVPVEEFRPRRSQRRTRKRNRDLDLHWAPAHYSDEHFELYCRYLADRHQGGGMDNPQPEDFRRFLIGGWSDTRFLEFRLGGDLLAVAVTDWLPQGLSAVYTYFDPDFRDRGLGVNAILRQIEEARRLELPYVYLGYWVEGCRKMEYKQDYRPLEGFDGQGWYRIGND